MSTTKLLETLLQIERSIGRADSNALRNMIMDAQVQVLKVQQDVLKVLEDARKAHERREVELPAGSWRAVAQAIAKHETEKKDVTRNIPAGLLTEMEKRVS